MDCPSGMEDQAPSQAPVMPPEPVVPPGALKVFGIMHIVFGALGLIGAVFTLISQLASRKILEAVGASMGEDEGAEFIQLVTDFSKRLNTVTYFDFAARLVLSVLILIAGIALVKMAKGAVQKSNLYAWLSIGLKGLMVILAVVLVGPATAEFYEEMNKIQSAAGTAAPAGMLAMQKTMGVAMQVVSPIIAMIYPILALVLLNRPAVKEYLAQHGK
jgi:hypothetical protein